MEPGQGWDPSLTSQQKDAVAANGSICTNCKEPETAPLREGETEERKRTAGRTKSICKPQAEPTRGSQHRTAEMIMEPDG